MHLSASARTKLGRQQEALADLLTAALPHAAFAFTIETPYTSRCGCSSKASGEIPITSHRATPQPLSISGQRPALEHYVRASAAALASDSATWSSLYRHWGPHPPRHAHSPDPRDYWHQRRRQHHTALWVPHAVCYVESLTSTESSRRVAPKLFDHIPAFSRVPPPTLEHDASALGAPATGDAQRTEPGYYRRHMEAQRAATEKGCGVIGPYLIELSLPVYEEKHAAWRRRRTLVVVADASLASGELLSHESDSRRRGEMRRAFGLVPQLLRNALPAAVWEAAQLCQSEWQHLRPERDERGWRSRDCAVDHSSALPLSFCLSAVCHYIGTDKLFSAVERRARCWSAGGGPSHESAELLELLLSSASAVTPTSQQREAKRILFPVLVNELALAVAVDLAQCDEQRWSQTYARNCFLPLESFDSLISVAELKEQRHRIFDLPYFRERRVLAKEAQVPLVSQ